MEKLGGESPPMWVEKGGGKGKKGHQDTAN